MVMKRLFFVHISDENSECLVVVISLLDIHFYSFLSEEFSLYEEEG